MTFSNSLVELSTSIPSMVAFAFCAFRTAATLPASTVVSFEATVETRCKSAISSSLTITKLLPSPVVLEVNTNLAPPSAVPVSIILDTTPKLSLAALIAELSCCKVCPAVTSIVNESVPEGILNVKLPAVVLTTSDVEEKPPSTASAVSIRLPLANCVTAIW